MKANEYIKKYGWICAGMKIAEIEHSKDFDGFYLDLKRLVKSHEYIESHGGLNESKRTFEMRHGVVNLDGWDKLKQAIAEVESCQ